MPTCQTRDWYCNNLSNKHAACVDLAFLRDTGRVLKWHAFWPQDGCSSSSSFLLHDTQQPARVCHVMKGHCRAFGYLRLLMRFWREILQTWSILPQWIPTSLCLLPPSPPTRLHLPHFSLPCGCINCLSCLPTANPACTPSSTAWTSNWWADLSLGALRVG